jgi:predicted nucleotidyltransferase
MTALIEQHHSALSDLCRRHGVERLYLFGSAAGERSERPGDLDFLVEMTDRQPTASYADRYLDFADELERLFGRRVDLVTDQSIRNPYFRREIEATRELVFGKPHKETPV